MNALVGYKQSNVSDSAAYPSPSVVGHGTVSPLQVSVSHRARETEMLYRLRVTGCCSRVALSEMLGGFAGSFATAPMQISPEVLLPGPERPNVPLSSYGCRVVVIFASAPPSLGLARRWWWRSEPLDLESVYLHLSPPIFRSFLAPPRGTYGAGAGRLLLLPYWMWSTPAFAPLRGVRRAGAVTPSFALPGGVSGAGAAAATIVLDVVYSFLRAARWRLG